MLLIDTAQTDMLKDYEAIAQNELQETGDRLILFFCKVGRDNSLISQY